MKSDMQGILYNGKKKGEGVTFHSRKGRDLQHKRSSFHVSFSLFNNIQSIHLEGISQLEHPQRCLRCVATIKQSMLQTSHEYYMRRK